MADLVRREVKTPASPEGYVELFAQRAPAPFELRNVREFQRVEGLQVERW